MCSALTTQLNYCECRGRHVTLRAYFLKVNANCIRNLDSSSSLLVDELLEVLWYDPQGCVRTTPIDIVNQLPLLIVLVRAQRRSKYLSGLRKTPVPGNFDLINQPTPRFQLVGRMTSWGKLKASTPSLTSTKISDEDGATHFFKSAWPEDIRPREHVIIATAITRANNYLPQGFRRFVLDHLPTISVADEIYFVGARSEPEHNT